MIVYGANDGGGIQSEKTLKNFALSESFSIPYAGHPAYNEEPETWRRLVYNFLKALEAY